MVEMILVQSNNIHSLGYDEVTHNLHIKFKDDNTTYLYKEISMDTFVELLYTKEKMEFLKQNIFNKYEKIAI